MKRKLTILLFLISNCVYLNAQQNLPTSVFSDRDVYVSGETMLVKAFTSTSGQSKVNYVDLLNLQGKRVSGAILEINNNQADGFLQLPDSLSTGTYVLRSYSKNTGDQFKAVKEVWIANRFVGLEKTKQIPRLAQINATEHENNDIKIENLPEKLGTNANNSLTVNLDQTFANSLDGDIAVSISLLDDQFRSGSTLWKSENSVLGNNSQQEGLVLSGTVVDKKNLQPAYGINVFFTIPDSIPGFQYYQTRSDGKFYFQLNNYSGTIQPFIQCFSSSPLQRLKITIDDSFISGEMRPATTMQPVTDSFKTSNSRNIDAITFQKIFEQRPFKIEQTTRGRTKEYPYYGNPNKTIDPHLFIDLPNFTEISRELLPGVKFRNYNNEPSLQVLNSAASGYFDDMPLTLIDGIPIRNLNLIKDMGTQDVKRIEICSIERFYGNLRFPGVVAIYTTKGDYSIFQDNDQFIHATVDAVQPKIKLTDWEQKDQNIPDLRQVLYWAPSLKPQDSIQVDFKTSSIVGKYCVSVWGRLKDGTLVCSKKQFEVK
ncbi:MAG TPA: hypothetical protein PLG33_05565 [Prolixibacteraceae bacterium]|nr:hypothetical protein [Prolixibacteraceae bacterium]